MPKPFKKCDCRNQQRCSHSWVIRYRVGGRGTPQREQTFKLSQYDNAYQAAKDFAIKVEHGKATYQAYDPAKGRVTFETYGETVLAARVIRPSTERRYRSVLHCHVYPELGHRSMGSLSRTDIRGLILACREKGLAPSMTVAVYCAARMVCTEAVRDKLITESPCVNIELPEAVQAELGIPSDEEMAAIEEALDPRVRIVVRLMAGCGLRPAEALAAHERCLVSDGAVYRVSEQVLNATQTGPLKHRRTGEYRDVPLPAYVAERLSQVPTRDGFYLPGGRTYHMTYQSLYYFWRRTMTELGFDFDPRGLRHRFASVALADGIPITDVSEWLGHRNIQTTFSVYRHLLPHSMNRARQVLDAARWC